jgi:hypothetical protein
VRASHLPAIVRFHREISPATSFCRPLSLKYKAKLPHRSPSSSASSPSTLQIPLLCRSNHPTLKSSQLPFRLCLSSLWHHILNSRPKSFVSNTHPDFLAPSFGSLASANLRSVVLFKSSRHPIQEPRQHHHTIHHIWYRTRSSFGYSMGSFSIHLMSFIPSHFIGHIERTQTPTASRQTQRHPNPASRLEAPDTGTCPAHHTDCLIRIPSNPNPLS